jgi:hypothetical protein
VSQATLVERQYEAASELSEGLGCALADVKRVQLALPGAGEITAIQVDASRQTIDNILFALASALRGETPAGGFPIELSASLVDWISTLRRGNALTPAALEDIRGRVAKLPTTLTAADFDFLDQLLLVVDAHANHLFHRLPVGGRI